MPRPDEPVFESAYDVDSNLRLTRLTGVFEVEWLVDVAPHDPTQKYLPDCLTLVDVRKARFRGSPADLSDLAGRLTEPRHAERFAWVIDRMDTVGMALLYQAKMTGGGRLHWFTGIDGAIEHLGVSEADVERATAKLRVVSKPD